MPFLREKCDSAVFQQSDADPVFPPLIRADINLEIAGKESFQIWPAGSRYKLRQHKDVGQFFQNLIGD